MINLRYHANFFDSQTYDSGKLAYIVASFSVDLSRSKNIYAQISQNEPLFERIEMQTRIQVELHYNESPLQHSINMIKLLILSSKQHLFFQNH